MVELLLVALEPELEPVSIVAALVVHCAVWVTQVGGGGGGGQVPSSTQVGGGGV